MGNIVKKLGMVAAVAVAAVTLTPGAAHAVIDCSSGLMSPGTGAWASCKDGPNQLQVRAWVDCWNDANHHAKYYGPWEYVGSTSIVYCPASYPLLNKYGKELK
jgi:hypothetical protein